MLFRSTYIGFAVRYNSNGTLDTSFGTNGIYKLTSSRQFVSVMALPNGSIILGGNTSVNNEYLGILVKLNSNGTEDLQFGRSEERRVGKECRCRLARADEEKKSMM